MIITADRDDIDNAVFGAVEDYSQTTPLSTRDRMRLTLDLSDRIMAAIDEVNTLADQPASQARMAEHVRNPISGGGPVPIPAPKATRGRPRAKPTPGPAIPPPSPVVDPTYTQAAGFAPQQTQAPLLQPPPVAERAQAPLPPPPHPALAPRPGVEGRPAGSQPFGPPPS